MASKAFSFLIPSLSEAGALEALIANVEPHTGTRPGYQILLEALNSIHSRTNPVPIEDRLSELQGYFRDAARNEGRPGHQIQEHDEGEVKVKSFKVSSDTSSQQEAVAKPGQKRTSGEQSSQSETPVPQEPPAKKRAGRKPRSESGQQEALAKQKEGRKPKSESAQQPIIKVEAEEEEEKVLMPRTPEARSEQITEHNIFDELDPYDYQAFQQAEQQIRAEIKPNTREILQLRDALNQWLNIVANMLDQRSPSIPYKPQDTIEGIIQKLQEIMQRTDPRGTGIFIHYDAIKAAIQTIKKLVPSFKKENIEEMNKAINSLFNLLNELNQQDPANMNATQQIITAEAIIRQSRGVSLAIANGLENVVNVQSDLLEEQKRQTNINEQRLEEEKKQTVVMGRLSRLAQIDLRRHNERLIAEWQSYVDDESLDQETRDYYEEIIKKAKARTDEQMTREDFDFIDAYDFFSLINNLASPQLSPGWAILFKSLRLILGFLAKRGRWKRAKSRFVSAMGKVRDSLRGNRNKELSPEEADAIARSLAKKAKADEQEVQAEEQQVPVEEQPVPVEEQQIREEDYKEGELQPQPIQEASDNPYLDQAEKEIIKRSRKYPFGFKQKEYKKLGHIYQKKFTARQRMQAALETIGQSIQDMLDSIVRAFNYTTQGMSQGYQALTSRMQNLVRTVSQRAQQMRQQPIVLGEVQAQPRRQPVVQPLQEVIGEGRDVVQRPYLGVDIDDVELLGEMPYYILAALVSTFGILLLTTIMALKKRVPKPPPSTATLVKDPPVVNVSKDGKVYTFNDAQELPVECSRKMYIDNKGRIRSIVTCMFDQKKEIFYDY